MSESDTFSTDVLKQMRQINSINLRNASPEEQKKAENDMKELFTNYKNNMKDDKFNVSIIQAMKGFEDKNPGLKVIDNYDDYKEIFGDRTVDSTNPEAYGPTYKRWGGKKRTRKYKKDIKKRKTKKHKRKIRR
jgi:hypothetical protein